MIKITFNASSINIGYLVLGEDVTARIQNDVRPVKATVIEGRRIEATFVDEEHAWKWMSSEGLDLEDMDLHLADLDPAAA
jgi:hypothetical protein